MYKIVVIVRDIHNIEEQILALDLPGASIFILKNEAEIEKHIVDADIIYWNPVIVRHFIHRAEKLKWFHSSVTWFDSLIEKKIDTRDYTITNTRVYEEMIAEYVFSYIFFFEKQILENKEKQKNRYWDQKPHSQLSWLKIGIMWTWEVAIQIAKTAKFFWITVFWYSLSWDKKEYFDVVYSSRSVENFLCDIDYLIWTLPDTPNTRWIIDKNVFNKMKTSSTFINVWRWVNVFMDDLLEALENNTISQAVLDVFKKEPLCKDSPLWDIDNLYITPHISWYTNDFKRIIASFTDNYMLFTQGRKLNNIININKWY